MPLNQLNSAKWSPLAACKRIAALGAALMVSASIVGPAVAADDWEAVLAAARQEGKVVVYAAIVQPVMDRLKADFAKVHPDIAVEAMRIVGASGNAKLEQERDNKLDGADLAVLTEIGWVSARAAAGEIVKPVGPSAKDWPADYMLHDAAPVLSLEGMAIVYNKNTITNPPTGYADLLKPEYKGKIGTVSLIASAIVAWYDWLEKTQGGDYLQKLAAQQPSIYASSMPGVQSVTAGEFDIIAFANTGSVVPMIKQGAPIGIVIPNPQFGLRYAGGPLSWAKRPNAAQVFADYLMSPRGQEVWHGQGETASPLPNIPGSMDASSITPFDDSAYPRDVVEKYTAHWNTIFQK